MNFAGEDVDSLLNEALEKVRLQIRTADRVVFLLQEGRALAVKAAHGRPGREMPVEQVSRSILRRVRRTGRTLFLSDALADNGLGPRKSIQEIGQRSVICAPLKASGKVIGLLYADTVSVIAAFTPAHLDWVNEMTWALNKQLEPLLPQHYETMLDGTSPTASFVEPIVSVPITPGMTELKKAASVFKARERVPLRRFDIARRSRPKKTKASTKKLQEIRIKGIELATFYRALASMLSSGITVHRALDVLADQVSPVSSVARSLHDEVVSGCRLSVAMSRFPNTFGAVHRSLITVGEETGSLDTLTDSLATFVEQQVGLRGRLFAAMTYPTIVVSLCIMGCMLAPPLFLNDFFETLKAANMQLPLLTRGVMALSNALWSPLLWAALGGMGWFALGAWRRAKTNRVLMKRIEETIRKVPVFGELRQNFVLTDYMQTLAIQLEAGLRLDKSLLLSASVSGTIYLQDKTDAVVEMIKEGSTLSYGLQRAKVFPTSVVEFLKLGEETGKMAECCRYSEALLREKAEHTLEVAEALLEPLAMAVVGFLVGIVALACMLPLVKMFETFL